MPVGLAPELVLLDLVLVEVVLEAVVVLVGRTLVVLDLAVDECLILV